MRQTFYIRAPFGFDTLPSTQEFRGHFNHKHQQGGDFLVFSDILEEAQAIVAPAGVLIADPQARNRAINAAYAKLWLQDKRLQWAGLAAFASKQVGCGLLHASHLIAAGQANQQAAALSPYGSNDIDAVTQGAAGSSQYVYNQLALGNTTLFLDVYPLHRFFQEWGAQNLERFLAHRENLIADSARPILWPIGKQLAFGRKHQQIINAFNAIEAGDVAKSVRELADHEQLNILQPAMYNNPVFHALMRANQVSFVTGFPNGMAEAVQLTLASQCKPLSDGRTVSFSNEASADLADPKQRMAFVLKAAEQFDKLLAAPHTRSQIEQSLQVIAAGGGVK
ncbi:hypothetical protein KIK84_01630 [Curvibacter sp. CHRR-16]|uniref:DUF2515 family protein n=1 Tax=Curvibacter sp. CHRR-16 TaxID=2835872 RepID=UPI001BDA625B|nr:hypothetical protein [Curvibacter sp. CHRR-16]MBT0569016.1 hypothetical protein [Curvibacter sp. CHRR-16]